MENKYAIGDILKRIKRPINLEENQDYKLVTIKTKHKGVSLREIKKGFDIKSNMYVVKEGDFLISGIDARHGAIGIVPKELDNAVVTNDFWYFEINEEIIIKELFLELTETVWFDEICKKGSDGTTNRVRLQKDKFFNQFIEIPNKNEQSELLAKILKFKSNLDNLNIENNTQQTLLSTLKQSILQEAIQGKLTADWRTQNPNTEPATELLKRIKAEKINKNGVLTRSKKEKTLAPISKEEIPFELPEGWVWCRLGDICSNITKGSSPNWQGVKYVSESEGILFITSKNVDSYNIDLTKATYVEEKFNEIEPRSILKKGDLLTNIVGASIGRTALFDLDVIANINQAVCILRIEHFLISKSYLLYLMNSILTLQTMSDSSFAPGRANLSMSNIASFPIPLPPLSEQQAIVEKVEHLMQKCQQLSEEISILNTHGKTLMKAMFNETFENKNLTGSNIYSND
jgi:type I restriction enzyme, S subunit